VRGKGAKEELTHTDGDGQRDAKEGGRKIWGKNEKRGTGQRELTVKKKRKRSKGTKPAGGQTPKGKWQRFGRKAGEENAKTK